MDPVGDGFAGKPRCVERKYKFETHQKKGSHHMKNWFVENGIPAYPAKFVISSSLQGGPLPVINGVITPINGLIKGN